MRSAVIGVLGGAPLTSSTVAGAGAEGEAQRVDADAVGAHVVRSVHVGAGLAAQVEGEEVVAVAVQRRVRRQLGLRVAGVTWVSGPIGTERSTMRRTCMPRVSPITARAVSGQCP